MTYTLEYVLPHRAAEVWPSIEPLVRRCIDEAVDGEYSAEDILRDIRRGQAFAFVEALDGRVTCVVVFHVHTLTHVKIADAAVIAGEDLKGFSKRVWPVIKQWAAANKIDRIEAAVSDAMYRMCKRFFGFQKTHNLIAFEVGEPA